MKSLEIRNKFLKYFESQNHLILPSSSLIPVGDPTLLLTTAGMVQFKPYFEGSSTPPNKRATTCQKSFRTPDIDEVGDSTHLTLFEMLGNFSFGDYFKEGAINFALDCLVNTMGLPKDQFVATIHKDDEEAGKLWIAAGIPNSKVFKFGDSDNWWGPAGSEGPCGPCGELHFDFGKSQGCGLPSCAPNCENVCSDGMICNRYVELWNLVFMQFYQENDGSRKKLPAPSVDTGMGLERLAVVLSGCENLYETDLFLPLIEKIQKISDKNYSETELITKSMRVIAEHSRSATFLIADGVVPSNEGRGYVLRRVMRRAIRNGMTLGINGIFLGELVDVVIEQMGSVYPELKSNEEFIKTAFMLEEERFAKTFEQGTNLLDEALETEGKLTSDFVFNLWDTYGFPVEITNEIASEKGVEVDLDDFNKKMTEQRERGKSASKFDDDKPKVRVYENLGVGSTKFLGYESVTSESVVVGIIVDGNQIDSAENGQQVEIVLQDTPFYPEGGGQVGDSGELIFHGAKINIVDTQMAIPGLIVHFGEVSEGKIQVGDIAVCNVNSLRRQDTARNHTATHMLHAALREILGTHVRQAGSLVAPDRLRFDFSHISSLTKEEILKTQNLINQKIRQNIKVQKTEDSYASAIEKGAIAFFGDKYESDVRLVEISNGNRFSFEVCGGTHVHGTGEVGSFYILDEFSIGSGLRRIEAVTGRSAEKVFSENYQTINSLSEILKTTDELLPDRVQGLLDELEDKRKQITDLETKNSLQEASILLENINTINDVSVLSSIIEVSSIDMLRKTSDWLRQKMKSGIVVLGSKIDDKPVCVVMISNDLVDLGYNAVDLAKSIGSHMGGGGGGKADSAQAGGRESGKLSEAISIVPSLLNKG